MSYDWSQPRGNRISISFWVMDGQVSVYPYNARPITWLMFAYLLTSRGQLILHPYWPHHITLIKLISIHFLSLMPIRLFFIEKFKKEKDKVVPFFKLTQSDTIGPKEKLTPVFFSFESKRPKATLNRSNNSKNPKKIYEK